MTTVYYIVLCLEGGVIMVGIKTNKRKLNAQITKKRIFKTAIKLFNDKGFHVVTVDEVVDAAKTSKGAFYNHYTSKDDILLEEFSKIDVYYDEVFKSFDDKLDAQKKLILFFEAICEYIERLGIDALKVIYSIQLKSESEKALINRSRPFYKNITNIVMDGQESGEFRDDISPEELTEMLTSVVRGSIYNWCLSNGETPLSDMMMNYVKTIVLFGILKDKKVGG
jgi:AcrR family transcriptional regulator